MKKWSYLGIVIVLLSGVGTAYAQTKPRLSTNEHPVSSSNSIRATLEYKANSEELLRLQEEEIKKSTQKIEQLRPLVADGLVARNELAAAEESMANLKRELDATKKKIGDSDQMIAAIQTEELRKNQSVAQAGLVNESKKSFVKPTVFRYNGAANWSIGHLAGIKSFFSSTFGRSLPTSTVGQSETHNRLGWDHRNSVDVALHPDSVEGRKLMSFLQDQGIPFLAFRGAIPGVSTGAHIHIGKPSQKLS